MLLGFFFFGGGGGGSNNDQACRLIFTIKILLLNEYLSSYLGYLLQKTCHIKIKHKA